MPIYDRHKSRTSPKSSDICLSCRMFNAKHPPENAVSAFHPTRLEWSYIRDSEFVKFVKESGATFAGTINTIGGHRSGRDCVDFDGNRLVAPWMRKFDERGGPGWACVNSPAAVEYRDDWLKTLIALNVDSIQFDDWAFNRAAVEWGGCFCSFCIDGFSRYLERNLPAEEKERYGIAPPAKFNYREFLNTQYGVESNDDYLKRRPELPLQAEFTQFQRVASRRYFDHLVETAVRFRGSRIPLSLNANASPYQLAENFMLDLVDYLLGETPATFDSYINLVWMLKMADSLRLTQIVSPFPRSEIKVGEVRGILALTYALGHLPLIPYDVWPGPDKKERWYGTPEEYGDIFEFVHTGRHLFDDFTPWSNVALFVPLVSDVAKTEEIASRGRQLAGELLTRGVAFRIITAGRVGGDIVEVPVEPSDFEGLHTILLAGSPDLLDENARKSFTENTGQAKVIDCTGDTDAATLIDQAILPSACKSSDPAIHVLARTCLVDNNVRMLHIINRDYDHESDEFNSVKGASLLVGGTLLNGATPKLAVYRTMGKAPVQLHIEPEESGVRIPLPPVNMWGTVEIEA